MKRTVGFGIAAVASLVICIAVRHYDSVAGIFFAAVGCVAAATALLSWFSGLRPDDDAQNTLMSVPTRLILALYLLAVGIIVIAAMAWLVCYDFTPHYIDPKWLVDSSRGLLKRTITPAAFGWIETPWWGIIWISREMQLFLMAIVAGALGSYIHAIKSLADFLGNRNAKTSWFWFYITRPFLGAALAVLFYAVIRGGFMAGTNAEGSIGNPYGVVAVCGLVGMFADRASQKLGEVFDTLFTVQDARKDKLSAADPRQLDPATVPLNGEIRDVMVRGSGLGSTAQVRVDNADRLPKTVGSDMVVFTLTDAEVTARRQFTIRLVTSGGDASKPLTLHISDLRITTAAPLPGATVGQAYGPVQLAAAGGTGAGTYGWKVEGLPNGLTGDATGALGGTPAAGTAGTVQVKITATDGDGATATATLPLTIT